LHSERFQATEKLYGGLRILHNRALSDFQFQGTRLNVRLLQDVPNLIHQRRLHELLAGEIDTHEQTAMRVRLPLPLSQLLTRVFQDPHADGRDQARVFSQ